MASGVPLLAAAPMAPRPGLSPSFGELSWGTGMPGAGVPASSPVAAWLRGVRRLRRLSWRLAGVSASAGAIAVGRPSPACTGASSWLGAAASSVPPVLLTSGWPCPIPTPAGESPAVPWPAAELAALRAALASAASTLGGASSGIRAALGTARDRNPEAKTAQAGSKKHLSQIGGQAAHGPSRALARERVGSQPPEA